MFIGRANECIEKEKKDEAESSGCVTMKRKERLSMAFEKKNGHTLQTRCEALNKWIVGKIQTTNQSKIIRYFSVLGI